MNIFGLLSLICALLSLSIIFYLALYQMKIHIGRHGFHEWHLPPFTEFQCPCLIEFGCSCGMRKLVSGDAEDERIERIYHFNGIIEHKEAHS